jgi:hypothetical protein
MAFLAAGVMQGAGAPNPPSVAAPAAFTNAADVLKNMRDNLPDEAIHIKGELLCGSRHGKLDRVFYLDADFQLGRSPAMACYTLRDTFGDAVEQLTITRAPDGVWRRDYKKGPPLAPAAAPAGGSLIGKSDITWNDLSLAFLWWTDGITTGREQLLERNCLVLEFAPPQAPQLTRVWIDESLLVLIKIEEYDDQRILQRRIAVRTLKKIGDKWLIKDLDVRRWPGERRTLLRLNDVNAGANEEVTGQQSAFGNKKP